MMQCLRNDNVKQKELIELLLKEKGEASMSLETTPEKTENLICIFCGKVHWGVECPNI
jgi:hypothetical protein